MAAGGSVEYRWILYQDYGGQAVTRILSNSWWSSVAKCVQAFEVADDSLFFCDYYAEIEERCQLTLEQSLYDSCKLVENELQINKVLLNDAEMRSSLRGVFECRELPSNLQQGSYMVHSAGNHWMSVCVSECGGVEFVAPTGKTLQELGIDLPLLALMKLQLRVSIRVCSMYTISCFGKVKVIRQNLY